MAQEISKLKTIQTNCWEIHSNIPNCHDYNVDFLRIMCKNSFRMYMTVYSLTLILKFARNRKLTKNDLSNTFCGILRSTLFLSVVGLYPYFFCNIRKLTGNFSILSVAFLPMFITCLLSIVIEKPSRQVLLSLYAANLASEAMWNMFLSRNIVKNIKFGNVAIFSISMGILSMYYRCGYHRIDENNDRTDLIFQIISRYVNGCKVSSSNSVAKEHIESSRQGVTQFLKPFRSIACYLQRLGKNQNCLYCYSCLYHTLEGTLKTFSIGLGIQVGLNVLLGSKKLFKNQISLKEVIFRRRNLYLAEFLSGFVGIFRISSCILQKVLGKDLPINALLAAMLASISFIRYPDTKIALYVLLKCGQISYNIGSNKGYLPKVPGFPIILYSLSKAFLFHVALFEPTNLKLSYWRYLYALTDGSIAALNRTPLDVWGFKSSESLENVLKMVNRVPIRTK